MGHFLLPAFILPLGFLLIYLGTELREQPSSLAVTFQHGLPVIMQITDPQRDSTAQETLAGVFI